MKMKNTELTVPILIVTPPDINIIPKEKSETLPEIARRSKNKPQESRKCPQVLLEKFDRLLDEGNLKNVCTGCVREKLEIFGCNVSAFGVLVPGAKVKR